MRKIAYKIFKLIPENPVSVAMDKFLERQLYLEGTTHVIQKLDEIKIDMSTTHATESVDGFTVTSQKLYEIIPENKTELFNELKNQFYMNLLVQTIENFESFLKRTCSIITLHNEKKSMTIGHRIERLVSKILQYLKLKSEGFLGINKDRIKFIMKNSSAVQKHFENKDYSDLYTLFILMENIRHQTVHASMLLTERSKKKININSKEFKNFFTITTIRGENVITVDVQNTRTLLSRITKIAYMIYKDVSEDLELNSTEDNFLMPPQEQMDEAIKFMKQKSEENKRKQTE